MDQQTALSENEQMAERIRNFASEGFAVLCARQAAAADSTSFDEELSALRIESAGLESENQSLTERLTAAQRMQRFENDRLIVLGKTSTAESEKLAALVAELKTEMAKIEARQREISSRVAIIEEGKSALLSRSSEQFKTDAIALIRGCECALANILDGVRDTLNSLETRLGTSLYLPEQLTADERTNEWATLHRMYSGAVR